MVDALASGASVLMDVEVRVLFWAPKSLLNYQQMKKIQWHISSQDHFLDRFWDRFVRFGTKIVRPVGQFLLELGHVRRTIHNHE